jgi:hypothetical protein
MAISRLNTLPFVATALAAWAGAQAQQSSTAPAAASNTAVSSTSQKAVTDKATATQSAGSAAAAKRAADADAVLIRDARNAGFTAENINGARMFCRLDDETGSRFLVKTCYDELQVRIKIDQYRTQRNELEAIHHLQ